MTLSEFKAWFDGFTESMNGAPDEKQWERIKDRVKEIDNKPVSYPVFVDRYVEPYRRSWPRYWDGGYVEPLVAMSASIGHAKPMFGNSGFDSHSAMLDLGKAEYSAALAS